MNWKQYEKEIYEYFSSLYPEASIQFDAKIVGRYSKKKRQIDILIEDYIADQPIRIVVDAKYFSKNVDIKCVESFLSMLKDVDAHQGLLITSKGFSEAAINRAYYGPEHIELDILNFDELLKYQGLTAVPYAENHSFLTPAPFGWVIDIRHDETRLATLYQRGLDLKKAQKNNEWMYLNFWKKDEECQNIDELIDFQNTGKIEFYSETKFEVKEFIKRKDGANTKIRYFTTQDLPFMEITGFIEFDEFIVFIILFTREELKNKNVRKLGYIMKYGIPMHIDFDNFQVIAQVKKELSDIKDPAEKSAGLNQIAKWYAEMKMDDDALEYYRLSMDAYPKNFKNIKSLLRLELKFNNIKEALSLSEFLFNWEPKNPTGPKTLMDIFYDADKLNILSQFFHDLSQQFNKFSEELGNINFHLAILKYNEGNKKEAKELMKIAVQCFKRTLNKNHQVFKSIKVFKQNA